jgi:hypothetical protein
MAVHRNLLRLRGFCMTPTERLLVYPYMANGSVASCLRGTTCFWFLILLGYLCYHYAIDLIQLLWFTCLCDSYTKAKL